MSANNVTPAETAPLNEVSAPIADLRAALATLRQALAAWKGDAGEEATYAKVTLLRR